MTARHKPDRSKMIGVPPGTRTLEVRTDCRPNESTTPQSLLQPPSLLEKPTLALLRLRDGPRPGLHETVAICSVLRSALQRKFDREQTGKRSSVFSGHAENGHRRDQHRHAHYLTLPEADERWIDRLVVWAPEGFDPDEVASLAAVRKLWMRDWADPLHVALTTVGDNRHLELATLLGPSDCWRSVTPFALPRHPKRRNGRIVEGLDEQVRRELAFRDPGLADRLTDIVEQPSGRWRQFRHERPGASHLRVPRVTGAELRFSEPVRGPLALGALSHFGLGLFAPQTR